MGTEIERRFLVQVNKLPDLKEYDADIIEQAYFSTDPWVRVRVYQRNQPKAVLAIKGKGTVKRPEVNCEIPVAKAREMWPLAKHEIHKIRHYVDKWELDEFTGAHTGLWLAELELELESEDTAFEHPEWLGEEVTEDIRYTNAFLAEHGLPSNLRLGTAHYIR